MAIELPRHVHRFPFPTSQIVQDQAELDAALAEGWSLTPQLDPPAPVMATVTATHPPLTAPAPTSGKRKKA